MIRDKPRIWFPRFLDLDIAFFQRLGTRLTCSVYLIDHRSTKNLIFQDNLTTIIGWLSGKFTRAGKILAIPAHPLDIVNLSRGILK